VAGLFTTQAARIAGMPESTFRGFASRLRKRSVNPIELRLPESEWPNLRTPLWNEEALRAALAARRTHSPKDGTR
jgi:hypothetical protein